LYTVTILLYVYMGAILYRGAVGYICLDSNDNFKDHLDSWMKLPIGINTR